jgi:ADP-ribose pyrophosphatase YjhB (NUDIX family)
MDWLAWLQTLTSIAQRGLTYASSPYDKENYETLRAFCAEFAASASGVPVGTAQSLFAAHDGYPTPKVDVRAAVFRDGQLLFVREAADGRWALPGGWADLGVTPGEVAAKEVREECGLLVRPVKLLAALGRRTPPESLWSVYKLIVRCELEGGQLGTSHETIDARFFSRDELPELSQWRTTAEHVALVLRHHDDPHLPTSFD